MLQRYLKEYPGSDPVYLRDKMPLYLFLRMLELSNKSADAERTRDDAVWMREERERRASGLVDNWGQPLR